MNEHRRATLAALGAAGLATALPIASHAQTSAWPSKPIRLVVPYPTGGPTDVLARIVAARLPDALGQPVNVDNRAGASGQIGAGEVARSVPDGHTLLSNASIHVINPSLYAKPPYDAIADFVPITQLATVPLILVVNNDLPVRSVRELIDYAKANPDKLNFGSSGNAAAQHLAGEQFKIMTGVRMQHVPYKGSAPALTDLIGGAIQLMFDSMPSAMPHVRSGKVRAIAVTTPKRVAAVADLPTIAEAGVPGYDIGTWYGVWAPKGTPAPIVQRVHAEIVKILAMPDVRERYASLGAEPVGSTPEAFAAYCASELQKWGKIVLESGAKAD